MIYLRNNINKKNMNKNEEPDKVINIVERILSFNKEKKLEFLKY